MSSPQQPPPPDAQASQAGLAALVALAIARLWPSLDLTDLRRFLPSFKAAVFREVQQYARASATLAVQQYARERVLAGVGSGFTPRPADPPPVEQVAATVDWAVQPLLTAVDEGLGTEVVGGIDTGSTAIADAKARLAAASERLVLDTGRNTIIDNVQADRKAKAWARIPEPGACSFCLMLATRGAVYRTEKTADFKSHNNCRCHVEPVFTAYEPSARIREAEALWASSTRGKSGNAARIAFRQAVEGRTAPQK